MSRFSPPDPPLADSIVALRPFRADDAPALAVALDDPAVVRWTGVPTPYTEAVARDWIATHPRRWETGTAAALAIVDAVDGRLLGSIELTMGRSTAEVAYAIAAAERGRGVASSAARVLADWALAELGLQAVELRTHLDNAASQRVAVKAGFARAGVEHEAREIRGTRVDLVRFVRVSGG